MNEWKKKRYRVKEWKKERVNGWMKEKQEERERERERGKESVSEWVSERERVGFDDGELSLCCIT